jgi:RHH-type rel operon transcriptional repressor/antitoxin RelB
MLALRLDKALEGRLAALAEKTGRTKSFYALAAIEAYLDELEDVALADERMAAFEPGSAVSLDELKADLGVPPR